MVERPHIFEGLMRHVKRRPRLRAAYVEAGDLRLAKQIAVEPSRPKCFYCGKVANTKDHVVPKSRGGRYKVHACLKCNQEKADMTLPEYRVFLAKKRGVSVGAIVFHGDRRRRLANG